jgi:hypothetical protein
MRELPIDLTSTESGNRSVTITRNGFGRKANARPEQATAQAGHEPGRPRAGTEVKPRIGTEGSHGRLPFRLGDGPIGSARSLIVSGDKEASLSEGPIGSARSLIVSGDKEASLSEGPVTERLIVAADAKPLGYPWVKTTLEPTTAPGSCCQGRI